MVAARLVQKYFTALVLALLALAAYFQAAAVSQLLASSLERWVVTHGVSQTRAKLTPSLPRRSSADAILARNPFDSVASPAEMLDTSISANAASTVPARISAKIRKISDTEFDIDRSAIDEISDNQQQLLRSVRIVPEMKDGQLLGVRLFGIRPGDLPSLLGLQNGDRLESINGFSMSDPRSALEAYARLPTASTLSIRLNRRGAPREVTVHIE